MVTTATIGILKTQMQVARLSIMWLLISGPLFAQTISGKQAPTDATQLVRAVIDNELKSDEQDDSRWMYRTQRQERGKSTVKEVIETKDCEVDLLVSTNGKPLTADQRKEEHYRVEKLVNNVEEQHKKMKEEEEDDQKATDMFKMLPDAFLYRYGRKSRSLVELTFAPNPSFHPPSREAQVFHGMKGTMWVDARKKRLVELDGQLAQDVQFLGGLIGHLDKGGRFTVKRRQVAQGYWKTTLIDVQMSGKAIIFKSISLWQTDSMTDFRRMPKDLSPPQAAAILNQGTNRQALASGVAVRTGN